MEKLLGRHSNKELALLNRSSGRAALFASELSIDTLNHKTSLIVIEDTEDILTELYTPKNPLSWPGLSPQLWKIGSQTIAWQQAWPSSRAVAFRGVRARTRQTS